MITNDERYAREIKCRIAMAKIELDKKKVLFFRQEIGLKFKEETCKIMHLKHSFVWCWIMDI